MIRAFEPADADDLIRVWLASTIPQLLVTVTLIVCGPPLAQVYSALAVPCPLSGPGDQA